MGKNIPHKIMKYHKYFSHLGNKFAALKNNNLKLNIFTILNILFPFAKSYQRQRKNHHIYPSAISQQAIGVKVMYFRQNK